MILGLTLRTMFGDMPDRDNALARTMFNDRAFGAVAFHEERFRNFGTIFTLDIKGSL